MVGRIGTVEIRVVETTEDSKSQNGEEMDWRDLVHLLSLHKITRKDIFYNGKSKIRSYV